MNKILKIALLLLLVLITALTPIYAGDLPYSGSQTTHIVNLKDQTVFQGEDLTVQAQLKKKGLLRDKNIKIHKRLDFYIGGTLYSPTVTNYENDAGVQYYYVFNPLLQQSATTNCLGKAQVTFDTSKLEPGTYDIYVTFDSNGLHPSYYKPSYAFATLTVLPNNETPVLEL